MKTINIFFSYILIVATLCGKKICFGINEVTKGLEKDQLRLVPVCRSCKPEMLTQHLIGLAVSRNCAVSVISNLSLTLCPLLKISSLMALGVKVSYTYSWPSSIQFCSKPTLQKKSTFHLEVNRLSLRVFYRFLAHLSWKLKGNFKQTWHKASLGKENSNLLKWRATPFSKGYNNEIANILWWNTNLKKSSCLELLCQFKPNMAQSILW